MICLFLAILELVKRQAIQLTQKDAFGDIGIEGRDGMEDAFDPALWSAIEEEYSA